MLAVKANVFVRSSLFNGRDRFPHGNFSALGLKLRSGREKKVIMLESLLFPCCHTPTLPFSHTHSLASYINKILGFTRT